MLYAGYTDNFLNKNKEIVADSISAEIFWCDTISVLNYYGLLN